MALVEQVNIRTMENENLEKEYDNLKSLYKTLQTNAEQNNQKIRSYRRELDRTKALESEYLQTIEVLNAEEEAERKKLEQKIHHLEERLLNVKQAHSANVEFLELEILSKDARIREIEAMLNSKDDAKPGAVDAGSLRRESEDNKYLMEALEESKNNLASLTEQNLTAVKSVHDLKGEISELNESYKLKKEELDEANDLIENLREQYVFAKSELDTMKVKPLEQGSQGNSLFAEIDDRSHQIQRDMVDMEAKYSEMKREKIGLLNKIAALQKELAVLCCRWETNTANKDEDAKLIEKNSYRDRIGELESRRKLYDNQMTERQTVDGKNLKDFELEYIEASLDHKNKEMDQVLQRANEISLSRMNTARELREANARRREWRVKVNDLECRVGQLTNDLEMLKLERKAAGNGKRPGAAVLRKSDQTRKPKVKSMMKENSSRLAVLSAKGVAQGEEEEVFDEHNFSNIDFSRQIKRMSKQTTDEIKENVRGFANVQKTADSLANDERIIENKPTNINKKEI